MGGVIGLGVGLNLGLGVITTEDFRGSFIGIIEFGELFNYSLISIVKQHYGFRVKLLAIINYRTIHIQHVIGDSSKD